MMLNKMMSNDDIDTLQMMKFCISKVEDSKTMNCAKCGLDYIMAID